MAGEVPFARPLKLTDPYMYGPDVEGVSRALCKAGFLMPLSQFQKGTLKWRRTYGARRRDAVNKLRKAEGWKLTGVYNEAVHYVLADGGYFDARAIYLIEQYEPPPPPKDVRIKAAIVDFTTRAESHQAVWHYTQHRPFSGFGVAPESTHYADCSAYCILTYYWAHKETGLNVPDPSGYNYKGWGNTWDDLDGHARVSAPYAVGDLAQYEGHVTICRRAGDASSAIFSSFGREAGPEREPLHYRNDLRFVCRPPLL